MQQSRTILIPVLIAVLFFCSSWGFLVHRTVNQLAVYQLPKKMRPFFYLNMRYLVHESVQPDIRRNADSSEAPKHFIDLERFGDSAAWKMPLHYEKALKKYGTKTLNRNGYVPYQVLLVKDQLVHAMRMKRKDSILFYAADLGHYIGDAHVPLHVTENYDGQLTNQQGLHSLWETMIPEIDLENYNLFTRHNANYLDDPATAIWNAIRISGSLLPHLLKQEKLLAAQFPDSLKFRVQQRNGKSYTSFTSSFAKAYNEKLGSSIRDRLISSAELLSDFWYTSWVDAGKPDLGDLIQTRFSHQDKKTLRQECRTFRRNELIKKNKLLAKTDKGEN